MLCQWGSSGHVHEQAADGADSVLARMRTVCDNLRPVRGNRGAPRKGKQSYPGIVHRLNRYHDRRTVDRATGRYRNVVADSGGSRPQI